MFDRTIIQQGRTEYVPYEKTVIEKRAPTDDSIKIYQEMLEKSYDSIIDTIEINDNSFNVKAIIYEDNLKMNRVCKFAFTINGREFTGEARSLSYERHEFIGEIIKKSAEILAREMIKTMAKSI